MEQRLREIGYYDPIHVQYFRWLKRALHLDLGYSIKYSAPVTDVIFSRVKNTLILTGTAFLLSILIGISLGIVSACKRNTAVDEVITVLSFLGISIPSFFLSLILIKVFSYDLSLLPASGMYDVRRVAEGVTSFGDLFLHMVLPVIVLTVLNATSFIRYTRSSMIEIIDQDYIKLAMAKGLSFKEAVVKHGLKNAMIPIITLFCMQLPSLFSGALMTETVFAWPGIGRLGYEAVTNRDYPLLMGILMISAILILLSNILADILYVCIDKRVELE